MQFFPLDCMREPSKSGKKEIWLEIERSVLVLMKLANTSERLNKGFDVIAKLVQTFLEKHYEYFSSMMILLLATF